MATSRREFLKVVGNTFYFVGGGLIGTLTASRLNLDGAYLDFDINGTTGAVDTLKITDVRTICTAPEGIRLVVVRVETDEPGLYGLGCAAWVRLPSEERVNTAIPLGKRRPATYTRVPSGLRSSSSNTSA